jgi:hypothetical protein
MLPASSMAKEQAREYRDSCIQFWALSAGCYGINHPSVMWMTGQLIE